MDERIKELCDYLLADPDFQAGLKDAQDNAYALACDQMLYGIAYTDVTGRRIDPSEITTP